MAPGTGLPLFMSTKLFLLRVDWSIDSENRTVNLALMSTALALAAGLTELTAGGVLSAGGVVFDVGVEVVGTGLEVLIGPVVVTAGCLVQETAVKVITINITSKNQL
jgi:hypothetical protein